MRSFLIFLSRIFLFASSLREEELQKDVGQKDAGDAGQMAADSASQRALAFLGVVIRIRPRFAVRRGCTAFLLQH